MKEISSDKNRNNKKLMQFLTCIIKQDKIQNLSRYKNLFRNRMKNNWKRKLKNMKNLRNNRNRINNKNQSYKNQFQKIMIYLLMKILKNKRNKQKDPYQNQEKQLQFK